MGSPLRFHAPVDGQSDGKVGQRLKDGFKGTFRWAVHSATMPQFLEKSVAESVEKSVPPVPKGHNVSRLIKLSGCSSSKAVSRIALRGSARLSISHNRSSQGPVEGRQLVRLSSCHDWADQGRKIGRFLC
eukprot:scaffold126436_cov46-Prasinocladus_malaysianus.AAC.1